MAYQIRCNDSVLYDPRDDDLIVKSPKCKLGVNTVGEASFNILANHPHYGELTKLRSVFEVKQDGHAIFRGRMTDESKDFDNMKQVDLEGAMAYFNDSIVRPFAFPNDFLEDAEYISAAAESAGQAANDGGVVRFFLKMLIDNHNSQVQPFQQFKLGKVTVSDPNNYITREDTGYKKTWETLKEKLFESSLGGFLCIRYEDDGNYIDYLADFEHTSTQTIEFGENLLNIVQESDATETYSAIIPLGKQDENNSEALTIKGLPDGNITDDIVKKGDTLYSKSAVEKYGWIYAPVSETTWEDVADAENLQSKGVDYIEKTAMFFHDTVTVTAFDLHLADSEIEAFRIYSYINASSFPHFPKDHIKRFPLTELDIDIEDPQNTKITLGESKKALTDKTSTTANRVSVIEAKTITAKKTIAEIEKKAADNEASISLLVQDGEANGEFIINAINGESAARIRADRLDIEGKKLNIKVESTNIEGQLTADQINSNGLQSDTVASISGDVATIINGCDLHICKPYEQIYENLCKFKILTFRCRSNVFNLYITFAVDMDGTGHIERLIYESMLIEKEENPTEHWVKVDLDALRDIGTFKIIVYPRETDGLAYFHLMDENGNTIVSINQYDATDPVEEIHTNYVSYGEVNSEIFSEYEIYRLY